MHRGWPSPHPLSLVRLVVRFAHGCCVWPVSRRSHFQAHLKQIFTSLHYAHATAPGRITALAMKEKVQQVLRVWQAWSLFPPFFLTDLENIFLGKAAEVRDPAAAAAADKSWSAEAPRPTLSNIEVSDDLDGKPLIAAGYDSDDDIDGKPVDFGAGAGAAGAAGAGAGAKAGAGASTQQPPKPPLVPMDEDLDGEPI